MCSRLSYDVQLYFTCLHNIRYDKDACGRMNGDKTIESTLFKNGYLFVDDSRPEKSACGQSQRQQRL